MAVSWVCNDCNEGGYLEISEITLRIKVQIRTSSERVDVTDSVNNDG